jgi:hypothetical protein
MSIDQIDRGLELAAQWRSGAGPDNPAGPLFTAGQYAQGDLTQRMTTVTKCSACTASRTKVCC